MSAGLPNPIFLDTNVYIIGAIATTSPERQILEYLGFTERREEAGTVIIPEEVIDQIARVAKRIQNKDLAGEILGRIWQYLNVYYVFLSEQDMIVLEAEGTIPREDIGVYLTAKNGKASCFISANHKLIRELTKTTGDFECLTPSEFVSKYLNSPVS